MKNDDITSKLKKLTGKESNPFEEEVEVVALSDEEKAQLIAEAKAKVQEEQKKSLKSQFLKEALEVERSKFKPGKKIVSMTIDLPGHSNQIILDGKHFFHGVTYRVNEDVCRSMMDIQARAWEHENEIGGANRDLYKGRAPINPVISPNGTFTEQSRLGPVVKF